MSASREKKKRQENGAVDPKTARQAEQRAAEKKSNILYGTLAVVFVVVAVLLVVYNSGIIQRNQTAVIIDGQKHNVAETAFYYQSAYQNFLSSQNGYLYTALGMLDTNKPLSEQSYDEEQTWEDYFKNMAVENMKFVQASIKAAKAEGMSLDSEDNKTFTDAVNARKSEASSYGYTYKAYLNAMFGAVMTPSIYESCLKDQLLASKYASAHYDGLSYTEEEIQTYYEENKNSYDLVDGAYVTVSGTPETKTDDDGNTIEATDEEKAAAMEEAKQTAEEILEAYKDGGDLEKLAEDHGASYFANDAMNNSSDAAVTWLFDANRKAGDADVVEGTSSYYVALFNSRQRDETLDYNFRHILVNKDSLELAEGEEATEEQMRTKAQEILDSWDGTEDGFAKLANENSKDGGSNTNGGLYEDVVKNQMVAAVQNWCYEDGRKSGDSGIVYNSSTGAHVMYFVGYGDTQYWHYACENMLRSNAQTEWETELTNSVTAELDEGGMKAIG